MVITGGAEIRMRQVLYMTNEMCCRRRDDQAHQAAFKGTKSDCQKQSPSSPPKLVIPKWLPTKKRDRVTNTERERERGKDRHAWTRLAEGPHFISRAGLMCQWLGMQTQAQTQTQTQMQRKLTCVGIV